VPDDVWKPIVEDWNLIVTFSSMCMGAGRKPDTSNLPSSVYVHDEMIGLRIEDLIQDPTARGAPGPGIVKRLSDALGVQPTFDDALNVLKEMHKFNNSLTLGLGGSAMTAKTRKKLLKETELHGDPRLREVMNNLGYHPTSYDLLTPKTKMMC